MTRTHRPSRRPSLFLLLILAVPIMNPAKVGAVGRVFKIHDPPADFDIRGVIVPPTATQLALAESLGARDGIEVRWNRFGTPHSLLLPFPAPGTEVSGTGAAAARDWLRCNSALFGSTPEQVDALELIREVRLVGHPDASAVLFRQSFGGWMPGAGAGLVTLGLDGGRVVYVSSSLVKDPRAPVAPAALGAIDAWLAAARDLGRSGQSLDVALLVPNAGWSLLSAAGFSHPQRARLVAVPIPEASGGTRIVPAWEVIVLDVQGGEALAVSSFVDARTGEILVRRNRVQRSASHLLSDPLAAPRWRYFPGLPPVDLSSVDTRIVGCWDGSRAGCDLGVANLAARSPWDVLRGLATLTTLGNAASTATAWLSPLTSAEGYRPLALDRRYDFSWGNLWQESGCSPAMFTVPGLTPANDADAAVVNLFVAHNRLHDWTYRLGFTEETGNAQADNFGNTSAVRENDPEIGNVQAGAVSGGAPLYFGRNNANQITLNDGIPPVGNLYLWQPVAASFYAPCVDGDFDLGVVAHEYAHAVSNRMIGGPDGALAGAQAGALGEAWSDLLAAEMLTGLGLVPIADENPYAIGVYVTGNGERGIRNYGMNQSPLNFGNIGYDMSGAEVHADGEIWSAVNLRLRSALADLWDPIYPRADQTLQRRCAEGELPVDQCPGNRRWIQLVFDSYLLMPEEASLLDARDGLLAADLLRFGGVHRRELRRELARRGLGPRARSVDTDDPDPIPDFASPMESNAILELRAVSLEDTVPASSGECASAQSGGAVAARIYVGDWEARSTPVAVTAGTLEDPAARIELAPGTYRFLAVAPGHGHFFFSRTVEPGETQELVLRLPVNWASVHSGATVSGDGVNLDRLIDDTEATNWARMGAAASIAGTAVTVELADGPKLIDRVQVSALLRPTDPEDPGGDTGTQNRFSALRQFEIYTCDATVDSGGCATDGGFALVYASAPDAFPGRAPRPTAPDLQMRTFDLPNVQATHLRLVVVSNQCTGGPQFQGDQDQDPLNNSDCVSGSAQDEVVRAAELQVFSSSGYVARTDRAVSPEVP